MATLWSSGPTPPTELPRVSIPPPTPEQVSGFWGGFWLPWFKWLESTTFGAWLYKAVGSVASGVIGALLSNALYFAAKFAKILADGKQAADPEFQNLARLAVQDMFGVDVVIKPRAERGPGGANMQAAATIGEAAMRGLFSFTGASGAKTIEPSDEAANAYITKVIQMGLEGWLENILGELITAGQIEAFGGLDDRIKTAMGLGAITSRIISPIADTFVGTPLEWKINKAYRPRLLTPTQATKLYRSTVWNRGQWEEELARQGYSSDRMEAFLQERDRYFSDTELDMLVASGQWEYGRAVQHLVEQGFTEEQGRTIMDLQEQKRLDPYRRRFADVAADAFVAGKIELSEWQRILELSELPEREQQMIRQVTGLRKELVRRELTMADVEQAVKRGILSTVDYRRYLDKQGYETRDAETLELLLLSDIRTAAEAAARKKQLAEERAAAAAARRQAAEERRKRIEAQLAVKKISLTQMEQLVRRGIRTLEDYRALLRANKYSTADVEALADLLAEKIDDATAAEIEREVLRREAEVRNISLTDFEQAVKRGLASPEDYRAFLEGLGYERESIDLLAGLLMAEIQDAAEAFRRREEVDAELERRDVSLADVEKGVRRGFLTMDQYIEFLFGHGFDDSAIALLVQLVESDIAADDEARDRRATAAAAAEGRELSLGEFERAVRAGIRPIGEYSAELARLGYSAADRDALVRLLELAIDTDEIARVKREAAAARLLERRVSLADVERAVTLGVVGMEAYRRTLADAGFPGEDRALLEATLLAEVAATARAREERARARALLDRRGLSLSQVERAVREGVQTIGGYEAFLVGQGFSGDDARTLARLLSLELEQARQAEGVRAAREAELARRDLTLGTWEAAVSAGIRPMADYRAFLVGQGFSAEDVATLIALLVRKIEAAAAGG